jgi:microcystin-dependent protein
MKLHIGMTVLFASQQVAQDWTPCDGREVDMDNFDNMPLIDVLMGSIGSNNLPNLADMNGIKYYIRTANAPHPPGWDVEDIIGIVQKLKSSATVPAHWMLCDGKQLETSQYQQLFASIGSRFGATARGDFFNLPNLNTGSLRYIICCEGRFLG